MTVTTSITPDQRQLLLALLHEFIPGVQVWSNGSRVTGGWHLYSDLDLVVFAAPKQHAAVAALKEALDESDLPFLVDLMLWDDLSPRLQQALKQHHGIIQEAKGGANDDLRGENKNCVSY
ncbi:MAG: nucleotidyltransferase domain-containing protein [Magnetococcales bacterium]|nr:nucleotidyltransferase domain-containing protein [Magnetococcales bacterium]